MQKILVKSLFLISIIFLSSNSWALSNCSLSKFFETCFGTLTHPNGDEYVGEVKEGRYNGQGTYTFSNGDKYIGEWKDSKNHGQGTIIFGPNSKTAGDKFIGEFKNNMKNGQGTYFYYNGNKYVGEWKDDKNHGQGTYTWANGHKYEGEYKDGKINGQGTYTWANGNKHEGEYKDGLRNGLGTMIFGPKSKFVGDKFVGEYKDDKRNGQGTYTRANGKVLEGIWKDDKFMYAQKIKKNEKKFAKKSKPKSNEIINASSGTGFAVSSNGHVITNNHVINGCNSIKIHSNGKVIPATVISFDPKNDIALLKGKFIPTHVLPLSDEKTKLLQDIYVAGYPFGKKISTSIKVTKGIISSLTGVGNNFSNFQIDAALQPGNSGGPILNDRGNVIGIAVAKLSLRYIRKNFGVTPENTNFGIKTSVVKSMLHSTNIKLINPNKIEISKTKLGRNISNATYYLSCWMTMAKIEQMKSTKVMFKNIN